MSIAPFFGVIMGSNTRVLNGIHAGSSGISFNVFPVTRSALMEGYRLATVFTASGPLKRRPPMFIANLPAHGMQRRFNHSTGLKCFAIDNNSDIVTPLPTHTTVSIQSNYLLPIGVADFSGHRSFCLKSRCHV